MVLVQDPRATAACVSKGAPTDSANAVEASWYVGARLLMTDTQPKRKAPNTVQRVDGREEACTRARGCEVCVGVGDHASRGA